MSLRVHEIEAAVWVLYQSLKSLDWKNATARQVLHDAGPHADTLIELAGMFTALEIMCVTLDVLARRSKVEWLLITARLKMPGARDHALSSISKLQAEMVMQRATVQKGAA